MYMIRGLYDQNSSKDQQKMFITPLYIKNHAFGTEQMEKTDLHWNPTIPNLHT